MSRKSASGIIQITFGEFVRTLRQEKRLPLRKVAAELDIDASTLGKIEKNTRNPTNDMIERMAILFDTDVRHLKVLFHSDRISGELCTEDFGEDVLRMAGKKIKVLRGLK